jgi:hypothetical protein
MAHAKYPALGTYWGGAIGSTIGLAAAIAIKAANPQVDLGSLMAIPAITGSVGVLGGLGVGTLMRGRAERNVDAQYKERYQQMINDLRKQSPKQNAMPLAKAATLLSGYSTLCKQSASAAGLPAGLIRRMVQLQGRRNEFMPDEEAAIRHGKSQMFEPIIQGEETPIPELMASPGKQSLTAGALAAAAGGLMGHQIGDKALPALGMEAHPMAGAAIGAGTLGTLAALYQYINRNEQNKDLEETMRRLPPGATKRDLDAEELLTDAFTRRFDPKQ